MAADPDSAYAHLLSPFQIGPMKLRNRVVLPPHASAIGNIFGSEADAERNLAYYVSRARGGAAWFDSLSAWVPNTGVIPGFEPTGVGATVEGHYSLPFFVERVQAYSDALHAEGAVATGQMVHQGGMPHGASSVLSAPVINNVPHKLNRDEIAYFVGQYKFCAEQAQKARLDGVELHMNHDDLLEYFLSPLTNKRDDEYGGSIENRCRFPVEVLRAIRDVIGSSMVIGIRLNLREEVPGGYDIHGAVEIAQYLESTGLVDYFHGVVGSPWGNPSYIQPHFYEAGQWSDLAGQLKRAVSLPVVHTGRINHSDVAERILAAGDADVVGMARAHIAEPSIVEKVRTGRVDEIRPCVGGNECISRRYVEGLPFGCAVNPVTSNEVDGPWPTVTDPRRVLVVGGGPAGMEFAALAREKGHDVELWEASDVLGGQLRTAINAPTYDMFEKYLDWQQRRLERAGVKVAYRHAATKAEIESAGFDVVAVATGSTRRIPDIPGVYGDNVADIRDVLNGDAVVGKRVLIVAQDDHMPPLSLADFLTDRGHDVTVVYATQVAGQLLGRYIVGAILGRLDEKGVQYRFMEDVVEITPTGVVTRNVYSGRTYQVDGFDSVVLACGGIGDADLYESIKDGPAAEGEREVHILGDAYAPRRLVFATRQAYALAKLI
ncbi:FAD-dependent oxidoreductase [Rhodococcus sp. SJ]|uniref:oxidoreductase n=1 Tax=Rhodococcus sp. SJ TaxID=3434112 RepID=UPI003D7BE495